MEFSIKPVYPYKLHMLKSLLLTIVGIAISAGSFAQTDSVKKPVFTYVEQMPKPNYPINTYLADSLRYPQQAKAESISGRVIVRFIVSETGSIDSVRLHKSVHPLLDSEAVRVVRTMPKWNPGIQNGQPVSVHYTMPVNFSLQDEQQVETDTPKLATQVIDGDIYLVKDKDANRVILQHPIKGEITIYTYLQKMPEPKYDIYKFISKKTFNIQLLLKKKR